VPDREHKLVSVGQGSESAHLTAARTPDGRLALIYLPSDGIGPREFALNPGELAAPLAAHWFNPARAAPPIPVASHAPEHGAWKLRTPGDNGTSANDWVLVLEAR
jgi:hypothetical protein